MTVKVCWLLKTCCRCGETKPRAEFESRKLSPDGKGGRCNKCKNVYTIERRNNPERLKAERQKERRYRRTERYREYNRELKRKSRSNPTERINKRISEAIRSSLRGEKKGRSWLEFVDFTPDELRDHLERQFTKGMSWDAFMRGQIHIDHIVPQSAFKFSSPEDDAFRQCWSLGNLRPLWALENITKYNKVIYLL